VCGSFWQTPSRPRVPIPATGIPAFCRRKADNGWFATGISARGIMIGIGRSACARACAIIEATDGERVRFTPSILPPYARRSKRLEVVIPILYLKGISTGDFEEPLAALLGNGAPGLSASNIARLKGLTPCPEYRPA